MRKCLCWSFFLMKLQAFHLYTRWKKTFGFLTFSVGIEMEGPQLYKREVFPCEIWKIFKNTYFEEHLQRAADKVISAWVSS